MDLFIYFRLMAFIPYNFKQRITCRRKTVACRFIPLLIIDLSEEFFCFISCTHVRPDRSFLTQQSTIPSYWNNSQAMTGYGNRTYRLRRNLFFIQKPVRRFYQSIPPFFRRLFLPASCRIICLICHKSRTDNFTIRTYNRRFYSTCTQIISNNDLSHFTLCLCTLS